MARFNKIVPQKYKNLLKHIPLAVLANLLYSFPSKKLKVIGVTGTDGKTTTSNMIYQILKEAGKKVSLVSSINAVIGEKTYDTGFHVTSPDSLMVQRLIKEALKGGSEYIVLEVTSHALDQNRFWGIEFDIGIITNVTPEHLDYHKTFENYLLTKARIIKFSKKAVINEKVLSSLKKVSRLKLDTEKISTFGLSRSAELNKNNFHLSLKIKGEYNLLNSLAAAQTAILLNIPEKKIKKALENFVSLEGRLDEVKNSLGFKIFVDFAHTPNALESALKALRIETKGNLISVFGCASERDEGKRPVMGEISAKFADITILTEEDSRFEDTDKIIEQIAKGAIKNGAVIDKNLFFEPDRKKALELAVNLAKKGDLIAAFGKGHEKSLNRKGMEYPWSDRKEFKEILNGRKN